MIDRITWLGLWRLDFRFISNHTDPMPHMLASVHPRQETGLEIAPYDRNELKWCIWLRSDIAHSKCRFCYIRSAEYMHEVAKLIEAISGSAPIVIRTTLEDEQRFSESLLAETLDCKRRREEYLKDDRWGRIPGGL